MRPLSLTGTIDRPAAADPQKQAPMNPSVLDTTVSTHDAMTRRQNRTREMQLIPEALARAHMQQRLYEAEAERPARRQIRLGRLQRRAERASLRARRALAAAVIR